MIWQILILISFEISEITFWAASENVFRNFKKNEKLNKPVSPSQKVNVCTFMYMQNQQNIVETMKNIHLLVIMNEIFCLGCTNFIIVWFNA